MPLLALPLGSVARTALRLAWVGASVLPLAAGASTPPWTELGGFPIPLSGDDSCEWGSDNCNACVFDVEGDFAAISDNLGSPLTLAFEARDDAGTDDEDSTGFQPELTEDTCVPYQIQGMGRLALDGSASFVFSRSNGLSANENPAASFGVDLGHLRSGGGHLGAFENTLDEVNQAVSYLSTDEDSSVVDLDPVDFYGGMQVLGTTAVVGGQCLWDEASETCPAQETCGDASTRIDFVDYALVDAPSIVSRIVPPVSHFDHSTGAVGAVTLSPGYQLVLVDNTYVYLSDVPTIDATTAWTLVTDSVTLEGLSEWPENIQNMSLFTECGSQVVYGVATQQEGDEDWMHLFRFVARTSEVTATYVASRQMYCEECDFGSSGNAYVTKEGQMLLYSSSASEGNYDDGDVYFEEFQNADNTCNDLVDLTNTSEDFARELDPECDYGDHFDDDRDGYSEDDGDCNDTNLSSFPGAPEVVDAEDNDCDGLADERTRAYDDDGDGFCEGHLDDSGVRICTDGSTPWDCDDGEARANPGNSETLDGIDNDCDGVIDNGTAAYDDDGDGLSEGEGDCNDANAAIYPGATELENGLDDDCDGIADDGTNIYDDDGDGWAEVDGDCNDRDAWTYPGAGERPDGRDNDCDGIADEGTDVFDDDGDGWSEEAGDCNDARDDISPDATEVCDGVDQDCDGMIDNGTECADDDYDGYSELEGDCDDANVDVHPRAPERPTDDIDQDCDGDFDGDGYLPIDAGGEDCDDRNARVYPLAQDLPYDGIDGNCDGLSDYDADGDGCDRTANAAKGACFDCDDTNPEVNSKATEVSNGIDDNCDGEVPELLGCAHLGAPDTGGGGLPWIVAGFAVAGAMGRRRS